MAKKFYIGTSGWQYKHWDDAFYPKAMPNKDKLAFFAKYFGTVEVNNTFYRLPNENSARAWHDNTPKNFRFAVKLNNYLTHSKKLIIDDKSKQRLKAFANNTQPLAGKLASVLVQLPPSMKANPERLEKFINEVKKQKLISQADLAVEFRHDSWFTNEVYEILNKQNISLVMATYPGKFKPPYTLAHQVNYVRFHATPDKPNYPKKELEKWADYLKSTQASRTYLYFNNDFEAKALKNAEYIKPLLD